MTAPRPPRPRSPAVDRSAASPASVASILLVDDDPSVCDALCRVLILDGWHVVTAGSGERALEQLHLRRPSLLITDLSMAKINGWDLLFHERLERPSLPIFVITALPHHLTHDADRFATEFFSKPVDPDALLGAVRRHLGPPPASH